MRSMPIPPRLAVVPSMVPLGSEPRSGWAQALHASDLDGLELHSVQRELLQRAQRVLLPVEEPVPGFDGPVEQLVVRDPNVVGEESMDQVVVALHEPSVPLVMAAMMGSEDLVVADERGLCVVQGGVEHDDDRPVEELGMLRQKVVLEDVEEALVVGGV